MSEVEFFFLSSAPEMYANPGNIVSNCTAERGNFVHKYFFGTVC